MAHKWHCSIKTEVCLQSNSLTTRLTLRAKVTQCVGTHFEHNPFSTTQFCLKADFWIQTTAPTPWSVFNVWQTICKTHHTSELKRKHRKFVVWWWVSVLLRTPVYHLFLLQFLPLKRHFVTDLLYKELKNWKLLLIHKNVPIFGKKICEELGL